MKHGRRRIVPVSGVTISHLAVSPGTITMIINNEYKIPGSMIITNVLVSTTICQNKNVQSQAENVVAIHNQEGNVPVPVSNITVNYMSVQLGNILITCNQERTVPVPRMIINCMGISSTSIPAASNQE